MKILISGFLALFGWSVISTYIYVCKIKELCYEPSAMQMPVVSNKDVTTVDTTSKPLVQKQAEVPENLVLYFAFDKAEFRSDAATEKYFNESNEYLNQNLQARLSITGHADAVGSDKYNQSLGYRRAQNTQHYFESKGMPSNKIIIESLGEKQPADDNKTKSGRANNRRTVITIKK